MGKLKMEPAPSRLPRSVYILAAIEFWERFSYYGFLGILVFFLTDDASNHGFGWSTPAALVAVGWITGIIWFAPVFGGMFADRVGGAKHGVAWGAVFLAVGNALIAATSAVPRPQGMEVLGTFGGGSDSWISTLFYLGIAAIVLGAGLFKSNASALLAQLFTEDDPRRERGFSLFYMSINVGALLAPLCIGFVAERYGWWLGFAASGTGMAVGVLTFILLLWPAVKHLPGPSRERHPLLAPLRQPAVAAILHMVPFAVLFMSGLMMYSGLLNLFARDHVQRTIVGFEVPATWFLTLNPVFIIMLGPVVSRMWTRLSPACGNALAFKVATGLGCGAAAFGVLTFASLAAGGSAVHLFVLVVFYLLLTMGELCIMPAGLAEIGARSPRSALGLLMGLWILTLGLGAIVAGQVGALAQIIGNTAAFAGETLALAAGAAIAAIVYRRSRRTTFLPPLSGEQGA